MLKKKLKKEQFQTFLARMLILKLLGLYQQGTRSEEPSIIILRNINIYFQFLLLF